MVSGHRYWQPRAVAAVVAVASAVVSSGAEVVFEDLSPVLEGVQLLQLFGNANGFDQLHLPALLRWLALQLN